MGWALVTRRGRRVRVAVAALLLALLPAAALCFHAALLPPPAAELLPAASARLLDRSGKLIAAVRDADGELAERVAVAELSPWLIPALLAAEDARFYSHPGVDPVAMLRAVAQAVERRRIASGASTITQQLARTLFERPRSLLGKWRELALSLRLEWSFDKSTILEAYFNRVDFGPRVRGVGAASRYYFDKPASALGLGEAATLVSILRSPTRYDPRRQGERLRQRRDHVLGRMLELGWAEPEAVERARRAPIVLHEGYVLPGAFHFVRAAVSGKLGTRGAAGGTIVSTLDGDLQRAAEGAVRAFVARFGEHRASAASVLVVENRAAAVRAYVGSPDYRARGSLGQNDGVLALRQPGSTLKPFVYAMALRDLGLHVSSVLPDLERSFASIDGDYVPHNYDRRFHGPVRLGQALAASLNVPAAALAERLGPEAVVSFLQGIGFEHLDADKHYGPGIALGVAEVQLSELAAAYATLGRAGDYLPLRFFESDPILPARRVLPATVVAQIVDVLSDPRERAATFGRGGPLELDFPVAVKTGTSKGNRDNWVVGLTREVTVAVWVGNFDGSPMLRSSGATGAGPLFHAVMNAAVRALDPDRGPSLSTGSGGRVEAQVVCALSGQLAGADCPHHLPQRFWAGSMPTEPCSWHRRACDAPAAPTSRRADGAGVGGCSLVEVLPQRYVAWAHDSGRATRSAVAPPTGHVGSQPPPAILFPKASARFALDGNLSEGQQQIVLRAEGAAGARLVFEIDGHEVCKAGAPFRCPWQLQRGLHELIVSDERGQTSRVRFAVE